LRNSTGELVKNTSVTVKISLLQASEDGELQYSEDHDVQTNDYGQFTVYVGAGNVLSGSFSTIDWSVAMYLKTEVANPTGESFINLGTVQLLSVPYALLAKDAVNKNDADYDPENEIQDLSFNNNILTITKKTNPTQINLAAYQGDNTDEQQLSLSGTQLSISGGNTIDLSPIQDGVNDADSDPTNELQIMSLSHDTIFLSNGGFVKLPTDQVNDADSDPTNELQNLILIGDTLQISNGNQLVFPYDSSQWAINGDKLYYNTGNVGIGTNDPTSMLEVRSTGTGALFQVINANNDTVFAVYPDGVKVFVDPDAKGTVGGFAVSGRTPAKSGEKVEYFRVTPDSTRIYVNDSIGTKGKVGGFAVSGRTPAKGLIKEYFTVNKDSTRIYIDSTASKGKVGGFAVSGRTPAKVGGTNKFMDMTENNYFIGYESGKSITSGLFNSFMGYQSGYYNTQGANNTFLGYQSGKGHLTSKLTGSNNIFIGYQTGYTNSTGTNNVFMGNQAGLNNTTGKSNVFLGNQTGRSNSTGVSNVAIGDSSGFYTNASYNSFIGYQAGFNNTSGAYNTFFGYQAGKGHVTNKLTGANNVIIGFQSGLNTSSGFSNVFIGNQSGYSNTTGDNNTFLGYQSGFYNTIASYNTIIGYMAGKGKETGITGTHNVFLGYNAGFNAKTVQHSTFIGTESGYSDSTGSWNVFVGYRTGYSNTTGASNTLIGQNAGDQNTTGYGNTFLGAGSGQDNTEGYNNVFVGINSGEGFTTGDENIVIGSRAGITSNLTGNYNIFIGTRAGIQEAGSSRLYIDQGGNNKDNALIYGEFDNKFLALNGNIQINKTLVMSDVLEVNNYGTGNRYAYIDFHGDDTYWDYGLRLIRSNGGANTFSELIHRGTGNLMFTTNETAPILFRIAGSERFRVHTNGNIGIYSTAPSEKLEIGGTSSKIYMNSATSNMILFNSSGINAPTYTTRSNGTKIVFYPEISGSSVDYAMGIESGTLWYSVPIASTTYAHKFYAGTTEIMKIRGDGYLQINANYASGHAAMFINDGNLNNRSGILIQAGSDAGTGDIVYVNCLDGDGTWLGSLFSRDGVVQVAAKSAKLDQKSLKLSEKNAMNLVNQIKVVDYENEFSKTINTGFIGEQLQLIYPEIVSYNKDEDVYAVSNDQLVPILTKAIQEQNIIIEKLQSELEAIKAELRNK